MQKATPKLNSLKAVDFFCGAGGMTNGFIKAGVKMLAGIDIDLECKETYEHNNPTSKFIHADIKKLTYQNLIKQTGIKKDDNSLIFIGCSPCQYWSKIKTNKSKSADTKNLLEDFKRFVKYFRPGFIVIENVPGILRSESPLNDFLEFLNKGKYNYEHAIINASLYGVPQTRKRFLLIASRVTKVCLPKPETSAHVPSVRDFIGSRSIFKVIRAGHIDQSDFMHTTCKLEEQNIERLRLTKKNGGTRVAWQNTELQLPAYRGNDESFKDVYGRMFWDKPAPTITTRFYSISNGRFAHPTQNRAISLREAATLQTFDLSYKFKIKSIVSAARLIGNAVPPELAKRIAYTMVSPTQLTKI
jgi:DNA (cytosine-5)-methyltransferase 1